MEANASWETRPSLTKACTRCRARKVKCDLRLPCCTGCIKQNDACDITDNVFYSYSLVSQLKDELNLLRAANARISSNGAEALDPEADSHIQRNQLHSDEIRKEAEEVGVLAIGGSSVYSENKYVGSATGSTFVRIFLKQLGFIPSSVSDEGIGVHHDPMETTASLPPRNIASKLLHTYIARVHIWWPYLPLPTLRRLFDKAYCEPRQCELYERFLIFMVLALASRESAGPSTLLGDLDMNRPADYFHTSFRLLEAVMSSLQPVQNIHAVLLLGLWMLKSSESSYANDLWQLSRHAMSLAIEAGLHRNNPIWTFSPEDREIRNRTWWCVYNLERQVAVDTGRVLSVRDHAVQASFPVRCSLDELTPAETRAAPTFSTYNVQPFCFLIELRRAGGRILESIYIARDANGHCPTHTFAQIAALSDEIQRDLEKWKMMLNTSGLKPSREYSELNIERCLLQLLLCRPSPTFMVPSSEMLAACSQAASSALHHWNALAADYGLTSVCQSFRQLHAIYMVGLVALYCDWQAPKMAGHRSQSTARMAPQHQRDAAVVLNLITGAIKHMGNERLSKHRNMFNAITRTVYQRLDEDWPGFGDEPGQIIGPSSVGASDLGIENDVAPFFFFTDNVNMDAFLTQVNDFYETGIMDVDDTLSAWYNAFLDEVHPQNANHLG